MGGTAASVDSAELFAPLRELIERRRQQSAELLVLAVHLLFRTSGTVVEFQLGGCGERERPDDMSWDLPFELFQPSPAEPLVMPATLAHDVLFRLSAGGQCVASRQPLWLMLARPYGQLGTLPWEAVLGAALGRPVLRLPDYPDRPAERAGVVAHVVLVDPPTDAPEADVVAKVRVLADAIVAGSPPGGCQVHVFTQGRWSGTLARLSDPPRVEVHDPAAAANAAAGQAPAAGAAPALRAAPWSNWIAAAMSVHGVDAVHLLCRARCGAGAAQLWLSASLAPDDTTLVLIDLDELCLLLNRAGASALTMLPVVRSQARALARVADGIAHRRPGAVLFHAIDGPDDEAALRAACAFLFARQPSPAVALRNGFLYCHPSFVAPDDAAAGRSEPASSAAASAAGALRPAPSPQPGQVPDWIGSAQRFVESAALEQVRKLGPDVLLSAALSTRDRPGAATPGAASTSSVETLAAIRNVVQDFLDTQAKE